MSSSLLGHSQQSIPVFTGAERMFRLTRDERRTRRIWYRPERNWILPTVANHRSHKDCIGFGEQHLKDRLAQFATGGMDVTRYPKTAIRQIDHARKL
jgi:hypothetical protein